MSEPERILPPITSSQTRVTEAAQALCKSLKQQSEGLTKSPSKPELVRREMTLAQLESGLVTEDLTENAGWDAGNYLKKCVPQKKQTGASLAGAAMRKMKT